MAQRTWARKTAASTIGSAERPKTSSSASTPARSTPVISAWPGANREQAAGSDSATPHWIAGGGTMSWLVFALMTVASWGLYGILLHTGQMAMGDPVNGRYKAFLFVGVAYLLTAVLAPLAVLIANGASWQMPA